MKNKTLEVKQIEQELTIARQIQQGFLPRRLPEIPGWTISAICLPARETGGDFYEFVRRRDNNWGLAIGDVSGKGLPASIYMTLTKGIFQSHANENIHPKALLSRINRFMYQSVEKTVFITLYFAILDPASRQFILARAGHLPALHYQKQRNKLTFLEPKGIGVGLENGEIFDQNIDSITITLLQGDWIIFYTDGFTEAMNSSNQEYGEARLTRMIKKHLNSPATELINAIIEDVQLFTAGGEMHDDMTMIAIKAESD